MEFPQLQSLTEIAQEKFAIEITLQLHGILDLDDGDFWQNLRWLTWRSRQNALYDLRYFLVGEKHITRRLADYFVKFRLSTRTLDETGELLRRVSDAIERGHLPPSDLAEPYAELMYEFQRRDRENGVGWVSLWGDNW